MKSYLLDTHVFIWLNKEPNKLTDSMRAILSNSDNSFYLSIVSLWEMQIKIQRGKLNLIPSIEKTIAMVQHDGIYQILPVTEQHIINLEKLPNIHRDPFDRMMLSQAITENMVFISQDTLVKKYPVQVVC